MFGVNLKLPANRCACAACWCFLYGCCCRFHSFPRAALRRPGCRHRRKLNGETDVRALVFGEQYIAIPAGAGHSLRIKTCTVWWCNLSFTLLPELRFLCPDPGFPNFPCGPGPTRAALPGPSSVNTRNGSWVPPRPIVVWPSKLPANATAMIGGGRRISTRPGTRQRARTGREFRSSDRIPPTRGIGCSHPCSRAPRPAVDARGRVRRDDRVSCARSAAFPSGPRRCRISGWCGPRRHGVHRIHPRVAVSYPLG